jgi:cyclase
VAQKRILPCLLLDGTRLVKTIRFRNPRYIGDPINAIRIFNEKEVDELVLLDITASREGRPPNFSLLNECASECFMPFSYGGGVRTIDDFSRLYKLGVEKVVVNTLCLSSPAIVREATNMFGSSSVVGSVDFRRTVFRGVKVFSSSGERTDKPLIDHCRFLTDELMVGELFICSVDRDGTWRGYDIETISQVSSAVSVPVIACGGAGSIEHIRELFSKTPVTGAGVGSMAVYQKQGQGVLISFPSLEAVLASGQR